MFFSEKSVTTRRIEIKRHAFEVRSNDLLIASPSIHKDGNPWTVLPGGTDEIAILNDVYHLGQQAKSNIKRYIDERLPEEYEKCLVGITAILREVWTDSYQTQDKREKIQALSLAKECYSMKLDLLTNATVVDDAIRFVSSKKSNLRSSSDSGEADKEESNEPDYDEYKDQLEEEQEEEIGEITTTINQVF